MTISFSPLVTLIVYSVSLLIIIITVIVIIIIIIISFYILFPIIPSSSPLFFRQAKTALLVAVSPGTN